MIRRWRNDVDPSDQDLLTHESGEGNEVTGCTKTECPVACWETEVKLHPPARTDGELEQALCCNNWHDGTLMCFFNDKMLNRRFKRPL